MKKFLLASLIIVSKLNLNAQTNKPILHGKHWIAITGKPLGATAGAMIFSKGGNAVDAALRYGSFNCYYVGCIRLGR